MLTAIIDYGSGNLRSAAKAFERAAADHGLAMETLVTDAPERVAAADRIVLPGVGAFADCMAGLTGIDGMVEAMTDAVQNRGRPFLGICVGMQLLASVGREHGDHQGFGWVPGEVVAIPAGPDRRVPHMGWQDLVLDRTDHPVLDGVASGDHVYFVHSYHLLPEDPSMRIASVDYAGTLTAAVARDTIVGTQFHPEKSQAVGLRLIANFLRWTP
ncbi:MAG: imidazole glycerol phosphate synthase subunit HisH [Rhodospirillaceae bacterium]|nr:imidazole glycerol phosphate synthase subunit HisH [Rhodospirillaceae bacterium]